MIYRQPNNFDRIDQLAHILSEIMNDNAPIGWERYRGPAACLLSNKEVRELINGE